MSFLSRKKQAEAATVKAGDAAPNAEYPKRKRIASRIDRMLAHENLAELFPQLMIDDDDHIVHFSDMSHGLLFCAMPAIGADGASLRRLLAALNGEMPPGTIISAHLVNTPHIVEMVNRYLYPRRELPREAMRLDPVLNDLVERRAEYYRSLADQGTEEQKVPLNSAIVVVAVKTMCATWPATKEERLELVDIGIRLNEAFSGIWMPLTPCDAPLYLMVMRRILRPFEPLDATWNEQQLLCDQILRPGASIHATVRGLVLDDEVHVRQLQPYSLPDEMALSAMAHLPGDPGGTRNQISCPFMISTVIHYPDPVIKRRAMKSKRNKLLYQALGPMRKWNTKIDRMLSGLELLTQQMEERSDLPVEMNFSVVLFGRDDDTVTREAARVAAHWASFNFQMTPERNLVFPSFWNAFPHMASPESIVNSYRFNSMTVRSAVQFLPILGEWQGSPVAKMTLLSTRRGKPFLFDLFDPYLPNHSAVLFAESGAGKSVMSQALMMDLLSLGGEAWVIDIGYSYKKICGVLGGEYIEFSRNSPVNCNPFRYVDEIDESMEVLRTIIGKMIAPKLDLDSLVDGMARGFIEEAIRSCWGRYGRNATPTSIAEYLRTHTDKRAHDLGQMMFPWTRDGGFGSWFEGSREIDFDNQLTVLELQDLREMPELLDVLIVLLINRINARMRHDRTNAQRADKMIFVDEAWGLLNNDATAAYLAAAARTLRKERGGIMPITQSMADLYDTAAGRAIAANAATLIVMSQKDESIDFVRSNKQVALSEYWWEQLKSVRTIKGRFSEAMFVSRIGIGIARLHMDRYMQVVTSTEGPARTEILGDIERGVPPRVAIDSFMAKHHADEYVVDDDSRATEDEQPVEFVE